MSDDDKIIARVSSWRSKLMDTSMLNPLLSLRKTSGVNVLNPDTWLIADKLYKSSSINLMPWVRRPASKAEQKLEISDGGLVNNNQDIDNIYSDSEIQATIAASASSELPPLSAPPPELVDAGLAPDAYLNNQPPQTSKTTQQQPPPQAADLTSEDFTSGTLRLSRSMLLDSDLNSIKALLAENEFGDGDENACIVLNADDSKLQSSLARLARSAKASMEDTGVHTMYLSIGSILWTPIGKQVKSEAPLFLLPVKLSRVNASSKFVLNTSDSELTLNPAFEYVSNADFHVDWSELKAYLENGFESISELKSKLPNLPADWQLTDNSRLVLLSYAKHRMWHDMDERIEEIKNSQFINAIVHPTEAILSSSVDVDWSEVDSKQTLSELCLPLPADASQIRAIARAVKGDSMVVKGPPGTGKSQTITNMICSILSKGKSVVFVAEKMTALSVVHDRMVDLGLGEYCLELHARHCDRKDVLKQMDESLSAQMPPIPKAPRSPDLEKSLNSSLDFIHTKLPCGISVHQAISMQAQSRLEYPELADLASKSGLAFDSALHDDKDIIEERLNAVKSFVTALKSMPKNSNIFNSIMVPQGQDGEFWSAVDIAISSIVEAETANPYELWKSMSISDLDVFSAWLELKRPNVPYDEMFNKEVISYYSAFKASDAKYAEAWSPWSNLFKQSIFKDAELVKEYKNLKSFFDFFKKRKLLAELSEHTIDKSPVSDSKILKLAHDIEQLQALRKDVSAKADMLKSSLPEKISSGMKISEISSMISSWLAWSSSRSSIIASMSAATKRMADSGLIIDDNYIKNIKSSIINLSRFLKLKDVNKNKISDIYDVCKKLKSAKPAWIQYSMLETSRKKMSELRLSRVVEMVDAGSMDPDMADKVIEDVFRSDLVQQARWANPAHELSLGKRREEMIKELISARKSDAMIAVDNLKNILHKNSRIPDNSPFKVLVKRELSKKRKIISPRHLLSSAGNQLSKIKPCMFMSPMSVAEFLSAKDFAFDVLIFDESSQIPTADAAGVISRAKQIIVVGDPKQMPPSKGFTRYDQDDDDLVEDDGTFDMDSILTEALASCVPSVTLNWHYRSRHEDLIAFSNRTYYNGELVTFPSPTTDPAFTTHQINGIYDRGKSGTNMTEAQAVVDFMEQSIKSGSKHSIGVVTFNQKQQQLIERLWDDKLSLDPELESLSNSLSDSISIKNLENVQGDERDIILFSTTFGKDITGKFPMNFGPLAVAGGERRLNVAITRARMHMHIFTSFLPHDIDDARLSNQGVKDFKAWLIFTRGGEKALASMTTASVGLPDSPFEIAVAKSLRNLGWVVDMQVGCSGYKIDLAVRHPNVKGSYLAAIECDGATYHSFKSARDRDHQRQKILEGLGWTVLRIWSTDWFEDAQSEIERIDASLKELI